MTPSHGKHSDIDSSASTIRAASGERAPKLAVILGSGLAAFAHRLSNARTIPYSELPGFPASTAPGHHGRLHVGMIGGLSAVVLQGRFHLYEGHQASCWLTPIRALKQAGVEALVITNAVGGMRPEWPSPSLMLVADHINGLPNNPLVGPNDDRFGVRFPDMTRVYDPHLAEHFRDAATQEKIPLNEGIYFAMQGPCFETPAEIRAMRTLGADVVGMSLVPEAIVARHCGLRIAAVSVITNHAAGISPSPLSIEEVLAGGAEMSEKLGRLVANFASRFASAEQ